MFQKQVSIVIAALIAVLVPASQTSGDCFEDGSSVCGITIYDCDVFCDPPGDCYNNDVPAVNYSKPKATPSSSGKTGFINTPTEYHCTTYFWCEPSGWPCGSGGLLRKCVNDDFNESRYQFEYGSQTTGAACP